jgi:hypothetical protein
MKKTRQHLRLDFQRTTQRKKIETRLESSRKRLLALALGASLSGAAACGDLEPIPAPDAGLEEPPMVPPQDSGFSRDASAHLSDAGFLDDAGETDDAGAIRDAGDWTDAGEPEDTGEIPPMPPPRDTGSRRDIPLLREDVGRTVPDTGEVPPMPPPRDTGVSLRDIGRAERDTRRPER